MSTGRQKGYQVETKVRKQFHGYVSTYSEIDFLTKRYAFEVKSANLVNINRNNGAEKKPYRKHPRRSSSSIRLGRFYINRSNHVKLRITSQELQREARYVFVLTMQSQHIKRVLSWEQVNVLINPDQERTTLCLRHVWPEEFL